MYSKQIINDHIANYNINGVSINNNTSSFNNYVNSMDNFNKMESKYKYSRLYKDDTLQQSNHNSLIEQRRVDDNFRMNPTMVGGCQAPPPGIFQIQSIPTKNMAKDEITSMDSSFQFSQLQQQQLQQLHIQEQQEQIRKLDKFLQERETKRMIQNKQNKMICPPQDFIRRHYKPSKQLLESIQNIKIDKQPDKQPDKQQTG